MIRDGPSLGARAIARKDKGEVIEAVEETFDGFVKLPNEGWCAKDRSKLKSIRFSFMFIHFHSILIHFKSF